MITKKELLESGWKYEKRQNLFSFKEWFWTHPFFPGELLKIKQARAAEEFRRDAKK